jgi:hypothetical protein
MGGGGVWIGLKLHKESQNKIDDKANKDKGFINIKFLGMPGSLAVFHFGFPLCGKNTTSVR